MGRIRRHDVRGSLSGLGGLVLLLGCGGGGTATTLGPAGGAIPGPWVIPATVLAVGDTLYVENTQAGPWSGSPCSPCVAAVGCAGGLRAGTRDLAGFLRSRFPQITAMAGYCCRDICSSPPSGLMSVHGTGRALDLGIPLAGGEANNTLGDEVGNWLIEHAQEIGIQLIIWDYWMWDGSSEPGAKSRLFFRASPHIDHLHVELSVEAAERRTPWFMRASAPSGGPAGPSVAQRGGAPDGASDLAGSLFEADEARSHGDPQAWIPVGE